LLGTFLKAGGKNPVLLVHDGDWGDEMISIMARAGGGLPARVLPFAVNSATQVGLEFLLTAAAHGAERILIMLPPGKAEEKDALAGETDLAATVLDGLGYGAGRLEIVEETDPEALENRLRELAPLPGVPDGGFIAMGRKRSIMALALNHLHEHAPTPVDTIELPAGAPFGAVEVDTQGCTICLACVGACPTGALKDNEDMPQLSFAEEACVQCGLCRNTCPESVITLVPRLSFLDAARSYQVIKEEEPFECVSCGKPFGAKSTIETMIGKLEGHSMFTDPGALNRLRMCDNCRVIDMTEQDSHPMAMGNRPMVRTTDDYLRERDELRKQAAKDMQEKGLKPEDDT
jgi:ferredoxin